MGGGPITRNAQEPRQTGACSRRAGRSHALHARLGPCGRHNAYANRCDQHSAANAHTNTRRDDRRGGPESSTSKHPPREQAPHAQRRHPRHTNSTDAIASHTPAPRPRRETKQQGGERQESTGRRTLTNPFPRAGRIRDTRPRASATDANSIQWRRIQPREPTRKGETIHTTPHGRDPKHATAPLEHANMRAMRNSPPEHKGRTRVHAHHTVTGDERTPIGEQTPTTHHPGRQDTPASSWSSSSSSSSSPPHHTAQKSEHNHKGRTGKQRLPRLRHCGS